MAFTTPLRALPSGRGAAIDVFRADLEACAPLRLRGPFDQNSLAACICNGGHTG